MKKSAVNYPFMLRIVTLLLFFSACAPAYVPNVINSPLFNNKNEVQINLNTGFSGFDPQVAYAITDHIGVMVNGSFANRTSDSTDDYHKHQFVEFGAGYYQKLGTVGRAEVFGGGGAGKLQAEFDNGFWETYADVQSMRFFVQPAIGISTTIFDGSVAARFVVLNLVQESQKNTGVFFEPALTAKVGYKYVKAVFQFGYSVPINEDELEFNYQPFLFSFGLQAVIGRKD